MSRFLTFFPLAENIHLTKDVGMIPYVLHKEFNHDSTIACYNNGNYPYLDTEVLGLKQQFVPKIFNNYTLDSLMFILFNFRKYDVVQCFHLIKPSLLILSVFKVLKGISFASSFTYLKLDTDDSIKSRKLSISYKILLNSVNLISIETKSIYNYLNENNFLGKKVSYIPNGFYDSDERKNVMFDEKENLIITVGRIGTYQKNNEVLLEGFKQFLAVNNQWRLEIIGSVEDDFKIYCESFFVENPGIKECIFFTGAITDRKILKNKYKKAKIFVLTSRFEGFPLVFLEAVKAGCTIISSNVTSAHDITDDEKYGAIFPIDDSYGLAQALEKIVSNPVKLEKDCELIQNFAYEKFSWREICEKLDFLIKNK
jgi:glycosyltransferase involved in cell wall biosynthesis